MMIIVLLINLHHITHTSPNTRNMTPKPPTASQPVFAKTRKTTSQIVRQLFILKTCTVIFVTVILPTALNMLVYHHWKMWSLSFIPTGHWHKPRLVSRDRPNPEWGFRLAGGGHPVRILSGHQHSGPVDVASPAECQRRRHLTVLPRSPPSQVSDDNLISCRHSLF